jgi:hypothetical protein
MKNNFIELNDLPIYDLYTEFLKLLNQKKIWWHSEIEDQICVNATEDDPTNCLTGRGSLFLDWDNAIIKNGQITVLPRKVPLKEENFTILCEGFKGSLFEDVYNEIIKKYQVGRIRIMKSLPKTCLTWHVDNTPRIHYPLKTQSGCFMVIENESKFLELNKWYYTNTVLPHTAFNGSKEERIHLVVTVLGNK